MRVSVVIPCYNSASHIRRTVESALRQTAPPLEVICVDDASTDHTWSILQELERETDGDVLALRHETNRGTPAAGRNTAIAAARGDWIAFLDHDDLWLPNKLERQCNRVASHPDVGLVHSDCWSEENDDASTRVRMHSSRHVPDQYPFVTLFHRNFVVCLTAMVRKDLIEESGLLNEDVGVFGVDEYDLWMRLARKGWRFSHVDEPLGVWRRHCKNASTDSERRIHGMLVVYEKLFQEDPGAMALIGPTPLRARLVSLHLERAWLLLKKGETETARHELEKVWEIGYREPQIWKLRASLTLSGVKNPQAVRRIKRIGRRFRERSRAAIGEDKDSAKLIPGFEKEGTSR